MNSDTDMQILIADTDEYEFGYVYVLQIRIMDTNHGRIMLSPSRFKEKRNEKVLIRGIIRNVSNEKD